MRKNEPEEIYRLKVVKRDEQGRRIRPVVMRQLLLDEKRRLMHRVRQIERELQTA